MFTLYNNFDDFHPILLFSHLSLCVFGARFEVFGLAECSVASAASCQRFRKAYRSHFKRSSSLRSILLGLLGRRKLRKIPEERRPQIHRGGSLKSRSGLYKCILPIIKI